MNLSPLAIRLIAYGLCALFSVVSVGVVWFRIAEHYEDKGYAKRDAEIASAEKVFADHVHDANTKIAKLTAANSKARALAAKQRAAHDATIEEVIRDEPVWAAGPAMPARAFDDRVRDLEEIAARARAR